MFNKAWGCSISWVLVRMAEKLVLGIQTSFLRSNATPTVPDFSQIRWPAFSKVCMQMEIPFIKATCHMCVCIYFPFQLPNTHEEMTPIIHWTEARFVIHGTRRRNLNSILSQVSIFKFPVKYFYWLKHTFYLQATRFRGYSDQLSDYLDIHPSIFRHVLVCSISYAHWDFLKTFG